MPKGEYPFKKVSLNDSKFSIVSGQPCKVTKSEADEIRIAFPLNNSGSWSFRDNYFIRLKDNVLVKTGNRGDRYDERPESFLVLRGTGAMELYWVNGKSKNGGLVIGEADSDLNALKSQGKSNMEAFDLAGILAEIPKINVKYAAQKKLKAAAETAAAQARSKLIGDLP